MKSKNHLLLPASVVIASIIIGGFFYAVQINKQNSIEKQQEITNTLEDLKSKQDECKALSSGVMKKWNNVVGVTYDDDLWEECVATYVDAETGKIQTSPLRLMQDN